VARSIRAGSFALALALAFCVGPTAPATAAPALSPSFVGEPPNGGGVFRFPQAVGFSPGGTTVFVGDQYSGVVQAFGRDGGFRFSFGLRSVRREPGRLGVVGGVATDRSGHVYVLDSENDRVQVFAAADGQFLSSFGDSSVFTLSSATPNVNGGISASGLAVVQPDSSSAPVVYVADQGRNRVERFTLDPGTLAPVGPPALSAPALGLDHPQGIALNPERTRLYVADDDNHRVVVLDPGTLALIGQVGSFGTGPGQFRNPYDVAVDAQPPSRLYVADNLNNRVDVFDAATLGFVTTFGGFGHTVGRFSIVRAVGAVTDDPIGGVAVADTANNRIQVLDASGGLVAAWGLAGRGAGYVTRARGVTFDPAGGVTIADTFDHRVERFDPDGTYAGLIGLVSPFTGFATQGPASGQFDTPGGVAYDDAGNLWVADTANHRVVELNPATSAVLFTSAAGELSAPRAVARGPAGSVYVADTGHGRIVQMTGAGVVSVVRTGLSNPVAVAFDGSQTVLAADDTSVVNATTGVPVAPPPGEAAWDHPAGLAVDPAGTVFVSERRTGTPAGGRVQRGTPTGGAFAWDTIASEGNGDAQVIEPMGLALSPDGATLLVADSGNSRVLRFDAPPRQPPVTQALTVSLNDATRGTVASDPAGIACATDCVQHFGSGRQVTLTATPASGSVFTGWGGDCAPAGTSAACVLTFDAPRSAAAAFAATPPAATPPAATPPPAGTPPRPQPPARAAPVAITRLRLSPLRLRLARHSDQRRHRPGRRATRARVSVTLSRPATVTLGVQIARPGRRLGSRCVPLTRPRRRATCDRFVALRGQRALRLASGTSAFTFTPVFAGRTLRPGRYRLSLTARDADGNRVGPVTAVFAVIR
jgi:sugar lactone lactonase YvrE